ncbi:MAG: hypothetical protein KDA99_09505 [Planctomycetales bacterium]|nr:hypothetical protein [Planctomycetales bacterium]
MGRAISSNGDRQNTDRLELQQVEKLTRTVIILAVGYFAIWGWGHSYAGGQTGELARGNATVSESGGRPMLVALRSHEDVVGTPIEMTHLPLQLSDGSAVLQIPIVSVAGIRFGEAEGNADYVALMNGDTLHGRVQLETVKFATQWGLASIRRDHIESVIYSRNYSWTSTQGSGETGWRIVPKVAR